MWEIGTELGLLSTCTKLVLSNRCTFTELAVFGCHSNLILDAENRNVNSETLRNQQMQLKTCSQHTSYEMAASVEFMFLLKAQASRTQLRLLLLPLDLPERGSVSGPLLGRIATTDCRAFLCRQAGKFPCWEKREGRHHTATNRMEGSGAGRGGRRLFPQSGCNHTPRLRRQVLKKEVSHINDTVRKHYFRVQLPASQTEAPKSFLSTQHIYEP